MLAGTKTVNKNTKKVQVKEKKKGKNRRGILVYV